jgi:hypothetical protein
MKPTLDEIAKATKEFSNFRAELKVTIDETNKQIHAIYAARIRTIKRLLTKVVEQRAALSGLIAGARDLFESPRTIVVHGIKIGLRKGKGGIEWEDDEQVVRLIKKLFPEQAILLIKITEKPIKTALAELPGSDLKRLGITVEETGDVVVIQPTDSEVDKLAKAMMNMAIKELEEAA